MNFQKIGEVPKVKEILHNSFRKARMKGRQKDLQGSWIEKIRIKESLKLDVVKDTLLPPFERVNRDFPLEYTLPPFYQRLMELTIDMAAYKRSLKGLVDSTRIMQKLHRDAVRRIFKCTNREEMKTISTETYGRIASVIKRSEPHLLFLDSARKIFRTYPDIKTDMFTVCIYGFPNVGKSTLLNKLTPSKALTAAYAFTTKTINSGFYTQDGAIIQVLDVPGTLARPDKMNTIELQAQLVLEEVAQAIIYVFDISEYCGYPFENQERLFKTLRMRKPIFVYVSKKDILTQEQLAGFATEHKTLDEIKAEIATRAVVFYAEQTALKLEEKQREDAEAREEEIDLD